MNGPTMRRPTWGSARRTAKPPRSTLRGTIMSSMASLAGASPGAGSLPGKKVMVCLTLPARADAGPRARRQHLLDCRCRSASIASARAARCGEELVILFANVGAAKRPAYILQHGARQRRASGTLLSERKVAGSGQLHLPDARAPS